MGKDNLVRGSLHRRIRSTLFLLPAWFSPHSAIRVFFHRLRGVRIGANVEIGYFCIIAHVHPHMVTIDDGAVVAAGAKVLEHDDSYLYSGHGPLKIGPVRIGRRAFVGVNAVILPNVTLGERSIVGANAVVLDDVESGTVVGGVPARVLKKAGAEESHP